MDVYKANIQSDRSLDKLKLRIVVRRYLKTIEDIRDGSQTHLNVNKREAGYKIRDRIKQRQSECKGALKATRSMGNFYTRYLVWL